MAETRILRAQVIRPANTTQYAINEHVSDSTDATVAAFLAFTLPRGVKVAQAHRLRAVKSGASVTNAQFRVSLLNAAPTAGIADNAVLSALAPASPTNFLGAFDFTFVSTKMLGAKPYIDAIPQVGTWFALQPDANGAWEDDNRVITGVLETLAAYTPESAEAFYFDLHVTLEPEVYA